jgi:hypothetical protein
MGGIEIIWQLGKTSNFKQQNMNYVEPHERLSLVNHPEHYQGNGIEVIDIIDSFELNFALGNAIKYILRADKKGNRRQDLEKARWYLNREISKSI